MLASPDKRKSPVVAAAFFPLIDPSRNFQYKVAIQLGVREHFQSPAQHIVAHNNFDCRGHMAWRSRTKLMIGIPT